MAAYGYDPLNQRLYRWAGVEGEFWFSAFDGWREIEKEPRGGVPHPVQTATLTPGSIE